MVLFVELAVPSNVLLFLDHRAEAQRVQALQSAAPTVRENSARWSTTMCMRALNSRFLSPDPWPTPKTTGRNARDDAGLDFLIILTTKIEAQTKIGTMAHQVAHVAAGLSL